MSNEELQEKIKLIQECQKVLYELHEEYGTRFAKPCADYLDHTLESLEKPPKKDARKEFAVGQKVTLIDTVRQQRSFAPWMPGYTYKKGTVGVIANNGFVFCKGSYLRLASEKVKVQGFDAAAVTEHLWYELTSGVVDTKLVEIDWEWFSDRAEEALHHLNYAIPLTSKQPPEITFEDLSKNQFWQDRQDLFKLED